jgi:hypothetical protein
MAEGAKTGLKEGVGVGLGVGGQVRSVLTTTSEAEALNASQK